MNIFDNGIVQIYLTMCENAVGINIFEKLQCFEFLLIYILLVFEKVFSAAKMQIWQNFDKLCNRSTFHRGTGHCNIIALATCLLNRGISLVKWGGGFTIFAFG